MLLKPAILLTILQISGIYANPNPNVVESKQVSNGGVTEEFVRFLVNNLPEELQGRINEIQGRLREDPENTIPALNLLLNKKLTVADFVEISGANNKRTEERTKRSADSSGSGERKPTKTKKPKKPSCSGCLKDYLVCNAKSSETKKHRTSSSEERTKRSADSSGSGERKTTTTKKPSGEKCKKKLLACLAKSSETKKHHSSSSEERTKRSADSSGSGERKPTKTKKPKKPSCSGCLKDHLICNAKSSETKKHRTSSSEEKTKKSAKSSGDKCLKKLLACIAKKTTKTKKPHTSSSEERTKRSAESSGSSESEERKTNPVLKALKKGWKNLKKEGAKEGFVEALETFGPLAIL